MDKQKKEQMQPAEMKQQHDVIIGEDEPTVEHQTPILDYATAGELEIISQLRKLNENIMQLLNR